MTTTICCTIQEGLAQLPLGPAGTLVNVVPAVPGGAANPMVNGVNVAMNNPPGGNGPFQFTVDANAWAAFKGNPAYIWLLTSPSPGVPPPLVPIN